MQGSAESLPSGVYFVSQDMRQRQVLHAKSYWGADTAAPLVDWLNRRDRPRRDPVERLLRMHTELALRDTRQDIQQLVARTMRRWGFALVPVVGSEPDGGWKADWRHKAKAPPAQVLAFVKLLHLGCELLGRVRECAWRECGKYFFAKFSHQECCSGDCRQRRIRSTEQWKKQRRIYMRGLRREQKLREQRQLELSRTKRKGHKR